MKKTTFYPTLSGTQSVAWVLLCTFCLQLFAPTVSYAGGPTQPEVQGFTPIGMDDMVDPFTGDFSYNIPLMDVDGYPINIAYSSGISMDQEASWVGLGWSLNMGSVVRSMRGLPDDFQGDVVEKTQTQKPNVTVGLDAGAGIEIFGYEPSLNASGNTTVPGGTINVGVGISHNSYTGFATEFSFGPSFNFGKHASPSGTAGFQLSGSSENGASFSPSLSFHSKLDRGSKSDLKLTSSIGASMNSRAGLSQISYSGRLSEDYSKTTSKVVTDAEGNPVKDENGNIKMEHTQHDFTASMGGGGSYNLGVHHYSPTTTPSMLSLALTGTWKLSGTLFGNDASGDIKISYSRQWIPDDNKTVLSPAYGYFNLDKGQQQSSSLLDFNRDDDGAFTKYTPNLPSAHLTNDIFSVQAQGIGGTYRAFRNEIGYVFDPSVSTVSTSGGVGVETGFGNAFELGVDLSFNMMESSSGPWKGGSNYAKNTVRFKTANDILEEYAMQEANERAVDGDDLFTNHLNGTDPMFFPLGGINLNPLLTNNLSNDLSSSGSSITDNDRDSRIKRNQLMTFLSVKQVEEGMGVDDPHPSLYTGAKDHHIGEITQLGTDGRRYVFGIPAYNHFQEDVTFATGSSASTPAVLPANYYDGVVNYAGTPGAAGTGNDQGRDNYYSSTTTPAYAHSFLLTAVLSDDYSDADAVKGPSDDDLGSYVKFGYEKVDNYKWRTPIGQYEAYYNEGLKSDQKDDKASFVYGEKDLWYVNVVETKNHIVIFTLEDRYDAGSAAGRNGGVNTALAMKRLKKISLYSKADYQNNPSTAVAIKEVIFDYDYSLCVGYPGNAVAIGPDNEGGKLTLTKITFTYQGSNKMRDRAYTFDYKSLNPSYNMKAVDRWGYYKPTGTATYTSYGTLSHAANTSDFPYVDQEDPTVYGEAWSLEFINLPSGGRIKVEYESDDYAHVQHLPAMQMLPIVDATHATTPSATTTTSLRVVSEDSHKNNYIYFKKKNTSDSKDDYVKVGQMLYFRCLVEFKEDSQDPDPQSKTKYDYVSGYAAVTSVDDVPSTDFVRIGLAGEELKDGGALYSPITKAAIQFGRMHLSEEIYQAPGMPSGPADGTEDGLLDFANSVASALGSFGEMISGPNLAVYNKGRGVRIVSQKSFIRLGEPTGHKKGGGIRVKAIRMADNWDYMLRDTDPGTDHEYTYVQEYEYTKEDGTSSGVATYEPMIGGDENPWHQPVMYANKKRFAMDDKLYIEEPVMESQFPSPSVGYSRVTIKNMERTGVKRTATGKIVKEFYTAKDFPTIVSKTPVDMMPANSFLPLLPKYQLLSASQGFTIELNDMHGKQKKESVYAEDKAMPISTVEYFYQSDPVVVGLTPARRLNNTVTVVNANGSTSSSTIGVKYDAAADFRENNTSSFGGSVNLNLSAFFISAFPATIPTVWPQVDISFNQFRSATLNKVVNRFGILAKTVSNQDGSIIETNNLAYDAQTGEILTTQTTTNFNDKVYTMNYPAHWKFDQMGMAYKNIGYKTGTVSLNANGFSAIPASSNYFVEGDEVIVTSGGTMEKGWILSSTPSGIVVIDKAGDPITASTATIEIVRSGRKNKQTTSMANLTSLDNPLNALTTNSYSKVLNAGAIEFKQDWNSYCDCFGEGPTATTNPFVMGLKGNWRPVKSYTHLSGRVISDYDNNTNIRRDGVFTSYTPYYKMAGGNWTINGQNWTYVSEVTEFSPNGMQLETRDALGRYSSSQYGFNNTLTTAVAANTRMKQLAVGDFEDVDYTNCMDQGFFKVAPNYVSSTESHSGRKSFVVQAGQTISFNSRRAICDVNDGCAMVITSGKGGSIVTTGGAAPYQLETEIISGTGSATISQTTGEITYTYDATAYFEMIVTVTDANGCKATYTITRALP